MRIVDKADDDGIQLYIPAIDESGRGFSLGKRNTEHSTSSATVVITPIQKEWLTKYSSRAICIDDTFNLTCYSLRLATVVVCDEWDKGLPAAFLLTNRMTEEETELLFMEIKKLVPSFDPTYFMSDDANSFFNGFRRVFPRSTTRKLLCVYHVVKAIERQCKSKLHDKTLLDSIVNAIRELCRTTNQNVFAAKYSELLAKLRESGEKEMLDYLERTWSPRAHEWGAFARRYSSMNTSMLIERFHRRLKHEVLGTKGNVRVDTLLDALVMMVPDMEEERKIRMSRGVWEGRYRLKEQHRNHALAIKLYDKKRERVLCIGNGRWTVTDERGTHYIEQRTCICDSQLNNHCNKDNCGACPYGYTCDCQGDAKSGISCIHIHAASLFAPE
ncbi:hypothetical protein OSTOST_12938, partial [Ostertagia ostertagi]